MAKKKQYTDYASYFMLDKDIPKTWKNVVYRSNISPEKLIAIFLTHS